MPEKRRKFEKDFKDGAVDIVLTTGRAVAEVARANVVHEGTLGNWVELRRRPQKPGAAMSHPVVREARKGNHQAPHRIEAALTHRLSNARVGSVNTKLRLLTRIAFGFRSPDALIALAMLDLGGLRPPLPGRATP